MYELFVKHAGLRKVPKNCKKVEDKFLKKILKRIRLSKVKGMAQKL